MNTYALTTRKSKVAGSLVAGTLADLQGPSKPFAEDLCERHRWRESKYNLECTVCGLVQEKVKGWVR